jgi:hypothetical protein
MEMTIAQAMKHKNRVVSRMHRLQNDIRQQNSVLKGNTPAVDVKDLMKRHGILSEHLVKVRTLIDQNSAPMKPDILRMAELRSQASFLGGIDTRDGKSGDGMSVFRRNGAEELLEYSANLKKVEVDMMVLETEQRIENIQDRLDTFNATQKFEVEVPDIFTNPAQKG